MRSRSASFLTAMIFAVIATGCGGGGGSSSGAGGGAGGGPQIPPIVSPTPDQTASTSPPPAPTPSTVVTPVGISTNLSGVGCTASLNATATPDSTGTNGTISGQAMVTCNQSGASCTGSVNVTGTATGINTGSIAGAIQGQGSINCTQPSLSCTATANISGSISGTDSSNLSAQNITGTASISCSGSGSGGGSPSPSCSSNASTNSSSGGPQTMTITMLTGYGWPDNTQPGSADISHPVLHQSAGGTGTFCDPITFAAAPSQAQTFPYGTIIYIPSVHRYFIREDVCTNSGPKVNAGNKGCPGTTLSVWVGGTASDSASSIGKCEVQITASNVSIIVNPDSSQSVTSGPIYSKGTCNP